MYTPYNLTEYTSTYTQSFSYDELGNMTGKVSSSATRPSRVLGDNLNYSYTYAYYANKAHQAERIGTRYYRYDAAGEYAVKYSQRGESLYFDPQWACQTDGQNLRQLMETSKNFSFSRSTLMKMQFPHGNSFPHGNCEGTSKTNRVFRGSLKNIYVGETRVATRLSISGDGSTKYEELNTYYYHADHLGSAQLVSDHEGKEYERIEYTPYGESWIEKAADGLAKLPYRFTGKERDSETGLYYYGARYLNPTTGLWLSTDPALAEYLPVAPIDEEAKRHNEKLPGMGGAYNLVNLALYHYAGNNPVRYTDPTGTESNEYDGSSLRTTYNRFDEHNKAIIEGLHPSIRGSVERLISKAKENGIEIKLCEGMRSIERQKELYNIGRDENGNITNIPEPPKTWALPGTSYHNYGLAIDIQVFKGNKQVWENNDSFKTVVNIAKSMGFIWGGDWSQPYDPPHFEMRFDYSPSQLKMFYDIGFMKDGFVILPNQSLKYSYSLCRK